jgi:hypothetical protein
LSNIEQQTEIRKWMHELVLDYDNPMIATLTYPISKLQESASKQRKTITRTRNTVISNLREFRHKISRVMYKNAHKRYGKSVSWVPILEGNGDNLHCHMLIDIPEQMVDTVSYPYKDNRRFNSNLWGYGISDLQKYDMEGNGISYITKFSTKEEYTESILYELM